MLETTNRRDFVLKEKQNLFGENTPTQQLTTIICLQETKLNTYRILKCWKLIIWLSPETYHLKCISPAFNPTLLVFLLVSPWTVTT